MRVGVWLLLMATVVGLQAGCSDLASVTGTITMDGQPVKDASVMFVGTAGGRPAIGLTNDDGEYALEYSLSKSGAEPGDYRVQISTAREPDFDDEGNDIPGRRESIPSIYNTRTELTASIEMGGNVVDFSLNSAGEIDEHVDPLMMLEGQ